jgi:hypothetical protein
MAKCERKVSGELAITIQAGTTALELEPDGGHFKADLEIGIADCPPDGSPTIHAASLKATVPVAEGNRAGGSTASCRFLWTPAAGIRNLRLFVHDTRGGQYGSLEIPLGNIPRL